MLTWLPAEKKKGMAVASTLILCECNVKGCGGSMVFTVECVKVMKVGENISCPRKLYTGCNGSVNASELKRFIGYGPAVGYASAASPLAPSEGGGEYENGK